MLTDTQLREALRDCYDPELPCNIVDLGLIVVDLAVHARNQMRPEPAIAGVPPRYAVHRQC